MYQLINCPPFGNSFSRNDNNGTFSSFVTAVDNTDYQRFKSDLANGVELKDADGNVMTSEQITEFLESLP
jgi:hypothetical protein